MTDSTAHPYPQPPSSMVNERSPLLDARRQSALSQDADGIEDLRLPQGRHLDPHLPASRHSDSRRYSTVSSTFDIEEDQPRVRPRSSSRLLRETVSSARLSIVSATTQLAQQETLGLSLLLLAAFFSSSMALTYTLLSRLTAASRHPVTALQVIFARMGMTYLACLAALRVKGDPHPFLGPRGVRRLLCARGVVGFGGIFGFLSSLRYLPLSDAQVINLGLIPIGTGLFCSWFLGENFARRELGAGVASLVGVALIARPKAIFGAVGGGGDVAVGVPGEEAFSLSMGASGKQGEDDGQRLFATCLALVGVVGGAGAFTIIRAIGTRASPLHSVSFFALYSTLVSPILAWIQGETWVLPGGDPADPKGLRTQAAILLGLTTGFGLCAQLLLTKGLQMRKGGKATTTAYTQAIWSCLFQLVFLHEPIAPLSAIGCTVILTAALIVAIYR